MEVFTEEGVASFPEFNDVSSTMKRESRFFVGTEKSDIQILTKLLQDLNSFLEGADAKAVEKLMRESVKSWSEQTKDSKEFKGCLVEEDCLLKLSKVLQERRIINFITRAGRRFAKLDAIRNQVPEPQKSTEDQVAGSSTAVVGPQKWKFFYTLANEYVDSAARDVILRLTKAEPKRSVLPLLGPHGIGKTVVARRVYESEEVKDHFDCRCWIDVSGSYNLKDVRKFMIKNIRAVQTGFEELEGTSLMDLVDILGKSLQSKRYLFVFDDVYQFEFWDLMRRGLPDDLIGSRIVITTTSREVVTSFEQPGSFVQVLDLDPLSDEMSWDLFCRIVFRDEPGMLCPKELNQLSLDVLRLCQGFPQRIMCAAGLLSMQPKLLSKWLKVAYSFKRDLENPISSLNRIAKSETEFHISCLLGYNFSDIDLPDLPEHLMPCLLYFSLFPKHSLIPTTKLFMLWIAEGFVENEIGKTLEEVAEEYLNELVLRELVEPCQAFYGFGQFCKVNALMHSTARIKADELGFCRVWDGANSVHNTGSRRLSIHNEANIVVDDIDSQIHSVFISGVTLPKSLIRNLINKCAFLTMLDFEDCPIEHFPEELSKLPNLKYLCLKNTKVNKLPKSIQKLQKLESLDCRNTQLSELPVGINKLKNLRHLLASDFENNGVRIKEGFEALVNLQTLLTIETHFGIFKELPKLKQLRQLGISGLTAETAVALCTCINELSHLESLTLQAMTINEVVDLHTISPKLPHLRSLVLKGLLPKLPSWIFSLGNLNFLCLSLSRLTNDPMKLLSHLPNLESLWLYKAYKGEQLYFEEGGFKKLKLLVIRELRGLNVLEIEDGALPLLEELIIGSSPLLNEVSVGISHLRNLKVLANYDMPKEFVVSMQPYGGSEFWKVKHIPSVVFLYRIQGQDYQLFKLGDSELLDHLLGLAINRSMIIQHPLEHELSFSSSDYEEDDDVGQLNFSSDPLTVQRKESKQWSFSSSFYTDDLEE